MLLTTPSHDDLLFHDPQSLDEFCEKFMSRKGECKLTLGYSTLQDILTMRRASGILAENGTECHPE